MDCGVVAHGVTKRQWLEIRTELICGFGELHTKKKFVEIVHLERIASSHAAHLF
jgi:hypothetical protein